MEIIFLILKILKYNLHLHDLEKFPTLRINRDLDEIENQLQELKDLEINYTTLNKVDLHRNYYLNDAIEYKQALLEAVNSILIK